ncbi:MAG: carboxypeptidase PM20D1 [Woeseiaceae bacterium]|jgi:carboxypeptidase PM20D1|tara:strand:- start:87771 stop:89186 length:1416 start_codon:yes stop_codon:yes gene_type:complete
MSKYIFIISLFFSISTQAQIVSSKDFTADYQTKALKIYRDTIAMRTARGHDQVKIMAHYLADRFRDGGFDDNDINVIPFVSPNGEEIASLVVRYRGDGSSGKKPILFAAHMDVVDALRKDWVKDPFTLIEENGYFFGRGTGDDKFGTTLLTATFLRLKNENFIPNRDLIIAFSGDEETEMLTIEDLVANHRALIDAEFAINADSGGGSLSTEFVPISYQLQAAEKTYADFTISITNPGGHSSRPRKVNAIYDLAQALKEIESYDFPIQSNDITVAYFKMRADAEKNELGKAMMDFSINPNDSKAAEIISNYPNQIGIIKTTCVATMLDAGHAENALPQSANANINCRLFPGTNVDEINSKLRQIISNPNIQINVSGTPKSAPASPLREDVMAAIKKAVHAQFPDLPIIPYMTTGATDGRALRAGGIPTYGTTGQFARAEDSFAHGLNERVLVKSFFDALEHWRIVIHELSQ